MKTDMAGAATAWAVIKLVASLGLDIGVKVYTPLVENMPSSTAIRPGDVLKMRNGKTLEVLNTCLLYTSPSPRDRTRSRMPSSA